MSKLKLNAQNLKNELWETLQEVRSEKMDPKTANAIAAQARNIISTIQTELQIQGSINNVNDTMKEFING